MNTINHFINTIQNCPGVNVKWLAKKHLYRITYRPSYRYAYSWDIWNHVKFMYETIALKPITTNDVKLKVFSKYIEVCSL